MRSNLSEVGFEDSLSIRSGELGTSDAEQVSFTREVLEPRGFKIVMPLESRSMPDPTVRNKVSVPQWNTT
jgi:uncharacterized protein (DUF849 family)